ncbi:MAG: M20 family metallopeptidase [Proteobacteria bacterium]|nr:M20 family metallopeptidase [Pseudomonadota bacterium]
MNAAVPLQSIVELLSALVRTPSRASEDDLAPVAAVIEAWFGARGLPFHRLQGEQGQALGLYAEVRGQRPGPWIVLDATLDTAGFGDPARWTHAPTSAAQVDGWLHGRGSADSKGGVALFAHLLQERAARGAAAMSGRLGVLFDLDEHSGGFGGARAFFGRPLAAEPPPRPDVVVIGYPGDDAIVTGGRGFLRARLHLAGVAAHSGAAETRGVNAIERALALGGALAALPLPGPDAELGLPPQLTLTGIDGGGPAFSEVPDHCELRLDVRLTSAFDDGAARRALAAAVQAHDAQWPQAAPTRIEWIAGWPPYRVPDGHPMVQALRAAGADEHGTPLPTRVVGPSNIGNYLASLQVPALCGYGLHGEGIHASDERVALASIAPVYRIYRGALQRLLAG